MVSFSNSFLGVVNAVTFIFSFPMLGAGIWLGTREGASECEKSLQQPLIVLGVFIMLISLIGLRGVLCHESGLRSLYLVMMLLLIVFMFIFIALTYTITNEGASEALAARGYKEYTFDEYLKNRMNDRKKWTKTKSCLTAGKICTRPADKPDFGHNISRIQSGCCKPSKDCKFTHVEATIWNKTNGDFTNPDCRSWDNNPNTLCYDCQSCKASVLDQMKSDWRKVAKINTAILVLLIIVYIIGCCASYDEETAGSMNSTAAYRRNPYAPNRNNYSQNPYARNPYVHQNPYAHNPNAYKQINP